RIAGRCFGLADDQTAAGKALADIVVGIASQLEGDAANGEGAEALTGRSFEHGVKAAVGQTQMTVAAGNLARDHRAERAIDIAHTALDADRHRTVQRLYHLPVARRAALPAQGRDVAQQTVARRPMEQPVEVDAARLPVS